MKKSHSKLRKVLPIALGLAVGGAGIAANADNIDYSFWNRTADFMLDVSYVNKSINRNEETNLRKLIRGGKGATFDVTSPIEAFMGEIAFLNSKEGKKFYNDKQRLLLTARYNGFINYCEKNNIKPSKKSLEKLSAGAKDGILEPSEFDGVEDGLYAFRERGGDPYRLFYLAPVVSDTTPAQYQAEINDLNNQIKDLNAQVKQLSQTPAPQPSPQQQQSEQIPQAPEEKKETQPQQQRETKKETDYKGFYLLAQQTSNTNLDSYTTNLGARWNPFKSADIGFEATLDLGFSLDKQTDSFTGPLASGRTAYGTKTDSEKFSVGGSLGVQIGPFFMDGGVDYKFWTQNILEQILDSSGNVLKSNTNSVPNRQIFRKFCGGAEMPFGNFKLGAVVGYNQRDGFSFGLRGGYKIK